MFVFQNEKTLKEFYLVNSFRCNVPISDQHYTNEKLNPNIYQTQQHPHQKYQNESFNLLPNVGQKIDLEDAFCYPNQYLYNYQSQQHPHQKYQNESIDLQPNIRQRTVLEDSLRNIAPSTNNNSTEVCQREIDNKSQDVLLQSSIEMCSQTVQPCTSKGAIRKVPKISCYNELVESTAKKIVTNTEEFVCSICEMFIEVNLGIVLKECFHRFCRLCIVDSIEHSASMVCPFPIEICNVVISDDQVQSLLTPDSYKLVMEKMIDRILNEKKPVDVNELPEFYYLENLDAHTYIENIEPFQCPICLTEIDIGEGVVLKNCLHMFCKDCLNKTIEHSEDIIIKCPFTDDLGSCEFFLQDCEFRALASENAIRQQHAKSLKQAELSAAGDAYHCKSPDCVGWVIVDQANAVDFICEVCTKKNCLACKVNN